MITPTVSTYSEYWDAIKAGHQTHVRMTFTGQNIVLDDSDIDINTGLIINDIFNGDTDLVFGKAISKQLDVAILNSSKLDDLVWTGEFTLEMGVEIGTPLATEWVQVGIFSGEKPKNVTTVRVINFTAYDRMTMFDRLADQYVNGITYPVTIQQIYDGLCAFVGITSVSGDELPNIMSRSYAEAPVDFVGFTCRDILAMIAEACGCYAKITPDGKVKLTWYTANTNHAITPTEEFDIQSGDITGGMTWDEADLLTWDEIDAMTWNYVCGYTEELRIDQIQVKLSDTGLDINYPYEYGGNVYMIVDNPFLMIETGSDVTDYVKPLYDRMYNFGGYLPLNVDCIGCWLMEAGDTISVSIEGTVVTTPVFVRTLTWRASPNDVIEATGSKVRSTYSTSADKQSVINQKYIKLYVGNHYYGIQSGIEIKPEGIEISGGKYVKIKSGGTFEVESGNFEIDADGNATFGGTLNSPTGTIGGFTVSGNTLRNGNFLINTATQAIITTDCYFGSRGFEIEKDVTGVGTVGFGVTVWGMSGLSDPKSCLIFRSSNGSNRVSHEAYFMMTQSSTASRRLRISNYADSYAISLDAQEESGGSFVNTKGRLGQTDNYWDIYGSNVRYSVLTQVSSRDIKHDINDLPSVGDKLDLLRPVTFVYDSDADETQRMGMIYEDTVNVMPEICTKDESDKAINYVELIPALLKEIQDLRKRVAEIERR